MYWPCQRGYLFGELVTYSPAKREVPGSTRPAGAVSHCYTTKDEKIPERWHDYFQKLINEEIQG